MKPDTKPYVMTPTYQYYVALPSRKLEDSLGGSFKVRHAGSPWFLVITWK